MISIVNQVEKDIKKTKMQVINFISHGFGQVNNKDNKVKPNYEKKKTKMKEQRNKPKKALSKENCKF